MYNGRSNNYGESSKQQTLHASVCTQLSTELMVIDALWRRSRDQHRSQLFLRHVIHIRRLGRMLLRAASIPERTDLSELQAQSERVRLP